MTPSNPNNAVNPLPPVVVALFLILLAIELYFQAGSNGLAGGPSAVGWRLTALQRYGFSGEILRWMWDTGQWPAEHLIRFVSYPFIHLSFTQTIFAGVMMLAMGKMVAEVFGPVAFLAVYFVSAIVGALVFTVLTDGALPLIGSFPSVYGLIGAFTWLLWRKMSLVGENQFRAFTLIGFLMGIQLIFALFFGVSKDWVADLAGFATGFLLSFLLVPGGWAKLLAKLRQEK
ncbi:rhomboid family intramembrane serine protease [Phaeobacter sp. 22II1-1F12B]|uniref:rhomboid family intramembrane serine protease n=1 Tax=Phaeobacter sp. 22II1-1F12B TaxID=1317111 RepID=UPI000B522448|nr:rhomboid family intramembrane serine protease [Phaeobacter sp. 22II1-1F12B]OWU81892.1 protease [Phaeobacter sp. 22II1-1F12B]